MLNVFIILLRLFFIVFLMIYEDEISSEEFKILNVRSYYDVFFKWKIVFGVCLVVIIILLVGKLSNFYYF